MANINGPSTTSGRGNLSFTTINLPRLAIEASNEANPGNGDGATAGAVYALFMHKLTTHSTSSSASSWGASRSRLNGMCTITPSSWGRASGWIRTN